MLKDHIHEIRQCAAAGLTFRETAEKFGVSYPGIVGFAKANGIKFIRDPKSVVVNTKRNAQIKAAFDAGETLETIGQIHGISRERVRQIVMRLGCKPRYG